MAMKLFSRSRLFYQQIKKEIANYNRVTAREGAYKTPKATPCARQSTPAVPKAGPSRLPDTALRAGSTRFSGL